MAEIILSNHGGRPTRLVTSSIGDFARCGCGCWSEDGDQVWDSAFSRIFGYTKSAPFSILIWDKSGLNG